MRGKTNWFQTFTGNQFWVTDPEPDDIHVADIAHALANICRFNGHCSEFYSVAQHSILVSHIVPPDVAAWGLLHDAAEAYLGDMATPIKRILPRFSKLEEGIMRAVAIKFMLPWPEPDVVKMADLLMLATERRDLMAAPPSSWIDCERITPLPRKIHPWHQARAEKEFLMRLGDLT